MEKNVLKFLESVIGSDFRDWSLNYSDALIYGIIIGFDDDQYEELLFRFKNYGLTEEYIEKIKVLHERWELLKYEETEHINIGEIAREKLAEAFTDSTGNKNIYNDKKVLMKNKKNRKGY